MKDRHQARFGTDDGAAGPPPPPATTAEMVERMTSRLANSLVIAAGIIGLGIYWGGDEVDVQTSTYQAVATADGRLIRVNTRTGSVVSCDAARCVRVRVQSGGDGDEVAEEVGERVREALEGRGPGPQDPAPQKALPAPGPSAPQAPQAQPAPAAPAEPQR
ncbi:MAG TPA: hypothetical protein VF552_14655 [Allosphingosinicella sp.]